MINLRRDVPLVEDVLYPPLGARIIDTEPIRENEVLIGGEEIHRGRIGTEIGHLVLLCRKGRIARMATTVPEGTVGGTPKSGRALDARR